MNGNSQSPFANLTPVVKNLLIINLICFLPFIVLSDNNYQILTNWMGLSYFNSPNFKPWQFVTYMFFHGGWTHILFNMFALFSFGPILEYSIGPKRFLNLYFICGIGAGILQVVVQAFEVHSIIGAFTLSGNIHGLDQMAMEKLSAIYAYPVIGASGAIFGLLVAFGLLFPNMELMMLFIPVPIKAKYLIIFYILLELYLGVSQFAGDNVAHFAHIGGAIFGFILIKAWGLRRLQ